MATNSYLRLKAVSGSNGRQIYLNIESISRQKGVRPIKIPVPGFSAEQQQAIPLGEQVDRFTIVIRLKKEASTIAYNVNTSGTTSAYSSSVTTTKEQYNFIYDEIVKAGIEVDYQVYIDFLDKTYSGNILVNDRQVTSNSFGQEILLEIQLTVGNNFIYDSVTS